jgi:hypothetical protein
MAEPKLWKYLNIFFACLAVAFAMCVGAIWFGPLEAQGAKPRTVRPATATPREITPPNGSEATGTQDLQSRLDVLKATVDLEKDEISPHAC